MSRQNGEIVGKNIPEAGESPEPNVVSEVGSHDLMELVNSLYTELDHRDRQLKAIRRISIALFPFSSMDMIVRRVLGVAIEVVDAQVGSVQLYDSPTDRLVFRYAIGPTASDVIGTALPPSEGINGRVFRTGVSEITHRVREDKDFNPVVDVGTRYHTQSMLTVPIKRSEGNAIGVMQVINGRRPFDQCDLEVLEILCAQVALAIENVLLIRQMQQTNEIAFERDAQCAVA